MNKQKEERLEELWEIKGATEKNHPGYLVTDVVHYNEKVKLINEEGEIEEFDLIIVLIQNAETQEEYQLYYLNGREVTIIELLKNRIWYMLQWYIKIFTYFIIFFYNFYKLIWNRLSIWI